MISLKEEGCKIKKSLLLFLLVILSLLAVSPGAFAVASPLAHWRPPFSIKIALATTDRGNSLAEDHSLCPAKMVPISGGTFRIGADDYYPDELSAEAVTVEGFCMDKYEITNAQFAQFVKETGYVTIAERPIPKEQFPDLTDEQRSPGSLVFTPPPEGTPVTQVAYMSWWHWTPGANWQHPATVTNVLPGYDPLEKSCRGLILSLKFSLLSLKFIPSGFSTGWRGQFSNLGN